MKMFYIKNYEHTKIEKIKNNYDITPIILRNNYRMNCPICSIIYPIENFYNFEEKFICPNCDVVFKFGNFYNDDRAYPLLYFKYNENENNSLLKAPKKFLLDIVDFEIYKEMCICKIYSNVCQCISEKQEKELPLYTISTKLETIKTKYIYYYIHNTLFIKLNFLDLDKDKIIIYNNTNNKNKIVYNDTILNFLYYEYEHKGLFKLYEKSVLCDEILEKVKSYLYASKYNNIKKYKKFISYIRYMLSTKYIKNL